MLSPRSPDNYLFWADMQHTTFFLTTSENISNLAQL